VKAEVDAADSFLKTGGEPEYRGSSESQSADSIRFERKGQEEGTGEESWIRIVRVSVPEEYAENTEIAMPKDSPPAPMAFSGGFRLEGNSPGIPCCLMVRTRDIDGKEFIQYLPWDPNHPNLFQAQSPMREYASVAVYEGSRLTGKFYIAGFAGDETISLDLNPDQDRRIASL